MSCILENYGHAMSQGGQQLAAAKPPGVFYIFFLSERSGRRMPPAMGSAVYTPQSINTRFGLSADKYSRIEWAAPAPAPEYSNRV